MATKNFDQGALVRVFGVFTNSAGTAIDPTTVKIAYRADAIGTTTIWTYGTDAQVVRSATGTYYADIDSNEAPGRYEWNIYSVGTGQAADNGDFYIRRVLTTPAPPSDPMTTLNSTNVTFLQAGTGAVTRSARDKMREIVSVKDFGAVGDGVTDDTTAFQTTLANATEGVAVLVPAGNYVISSNPFAGISRPFTLLLEDVTITSSVAWNLTNTQQVSIRGAGRSTRIVFQAGTPFTAAAFTITTASSVEISNIHFSGGQSPVTVAEMILATGGSGVNIHDCYFTGVTYDSPTLAVGAVRFSSHTDGWAVRNVFAENGAPSTTNVNFEVGVYGGSSSRIHVIDNTIVGQDTTVAISMSDCNEADVRGNTIDQGNTKYPATQVGGYGILLYDANATLPLYSRVEDNYIYNCAGSGIYLADVERVVISGNVLKDVCKQQLDGALPVGAISLNEVGSSTISNNTIDGSDQYGIRTSGSVSNAITGNAIRDCSIAGIYINHGNAMNAEDTTIIGNTITSTQYGAILGSGSALTSRILVADNAIRTTTAVGIYIDANSCAVSGNLIQGVAGTAISNISGNYTVISGNRIINTTGTGNGIGVGSVTSCNISGNIITGGTGTGIALSSTTDTIFAYNTLTSNNQSFTEAAAGLRSQWLYNRGVGNTNVAPSVSSSTAILRGNQRTTGAWLGQSTLVGGTVTVSTIEVAAADNIILTRIAQSGTPGHLTVGTITAGASFVVSSSSATDASTIYWEIVH